MKNKLTAIAIILTLLIFAGCSKNNMDSKSVSKNSNQKSEVTSNSNSKKTNIQYSGPNMLLPIPGKDGQGYIDRSGKIVAKPQFAFAFSFNIKEGIAKYMTVEQKFGFLDVNGKNVFKQLFDGATAFNDGVSAVSINNKSWIIDKNGNFLAGPLDGYINEFSEGLAAVWPDSYKEKCYYIDKSGKKVITTNFNKGYPFIDGMAIVEKDSKKGFIDKAGKVIVNTEYEDAYNFVDGIARLLISGDKDDRFIVKTYYVDKTGKKIEGNFAGGHDFSEGLAAACDLSSDSDDYGYIDKTGKFIIKPQFGDANDFKEGLAGVMVFPYYGFIDKTGKMVIEAKYNYVGAFSDGLAAVKDDGKWGYIDKSGNLVIPFQFDGFPMGDGTGSFQNGIAYVREGGKYGYIDKSGEYIWREE